MIQSYLRDNQSHGGRWERPADAPPPPRDVVLRRAELVGPDGRVTGVVNAEDEFRIAVDYDVIRSTPNFEIGISLRNQEGVTVLVSLDSDTGEWPDRARPVGSYRSECVIPAHLLSPTTYTLTFAAHVINQQTHDTQHDALTFEVTEAGCIRTKRNDRRAGVITPIFDWRIGKLS